MAEKHAQNQLECFSNLEINENFTLRDLLVGSFPLKKPRENLSSIVFINLAKKQKSKEGLTLKALLDTGATTTLVNSKFVKKHKRHKCKPTK